MLRPGQIIKRAEGYWVVARVGTSSAYILPLTGKKRPITTRKGVTKVISSKPPGTHISAGALVEEITHPSLYLEQLRRKAMAEATAEAAETKVKAPRKTQVYVRTEKTAKEMKGQGAVVLNALNELGRGTVAELVAATKGKFETRQGEERVVGFYLSKFKREGLAKVVEVEETEGTTGEAAEEIAE